MIRTVAILLLICFGVTACAPAGEEMPTIVLGEGTFLEMLYISPLPESDALPVNTDELDAKQFDFSVSGMETVEASGEGYFTQDLSIGIYINLPYRFSDGAVNQAVTIALPNNIEVGTYRIFPFGQVFNLTQEIVGVGGTYITQPPPEYDFPFYSYDKATEGVVTLTALEPMTGAFRFTAEDNAGKSVTVEGTFNQLELSYPEF